MCICIWNLWINFLVIQIYETKTILYNEGVSQIYSNMSNNQLNVQGKYFIFWTNLSVVNVSCFPNVKLTINHSLEYLLIDYDFHTKSSKDYYNLSIFMIVENIIKLYTIILKINDIQDFEIIPRGNNVNLPHNFSAKCVTKVKIILYLIIRNIINIQKEDCYISTHIPAMNITLLTVYAFIKHGDTWSNYSKSYNIGRKPTILIITSRFPKLREKVRCLSDGENKFYKFKWFCFDENQPYDTIATYYISHVDNNLIFWDTAPLIDYQCMCLAKFVNQLNQTIFSVSVNNKLSLKNCHLANCDLNYNTLSDFKWGIVTLSFLLLFIAPVAFILLLTQGIFKDRIQSEILNKLGFIESELSLSGSIIPKFFLSKSDVGEVKFRAFLENLRDLEKKIATLKYYNNPNETNYKNVFQMVTPRNRSFKGRDNRRTLLEQYHVDVKEIVAHRKEAIRNELIQRSKLKKDLLKDTNNRDKPKNKVKQWSYNIIKAKSLYRPHEESKIFNISEATDKASEPVLISSRRSTRVSHPKKKLPRVLKESSMMSKVRQIVESTQDLPNHGTSIVAKGTKKRSLNTRNKSVNTVGLKTQSEYYIKQFSSNDSEISSQILSISYDPFPTNSGYLQNIYNL